MDISLKSKTLLAGALALFGIWSGSAMATAVDFDLRVQVGWAVPSATCIDPPNDCVGYSGAGGFGGTALFLNWDDTTPAIDSFLRIGALPDSTVGFVGDATTTIGNGDTVRTAQIQHENNVIPADDDRLATVQLITLLTLSWNNVIVFQAPFNPVVGFLETLNRAPCVETSNTLGSICDDQFTFADPTATAQFTHDGHLYQISLDGLFFDDGTEACEDAGGGQLNCLTAEGVISDRFVEVTLTKIPEPATLALLGLGLLGMGAAGRRRSRRNA